MKNLLQLSILFFVFGLFISCEKENNPPAIKIAIASPQKIITGEITQLTCVATDPDGDQLTYSWYASDGSFPQGTVGNSISWKAPDEPKDYKISVIVNDGQITADGSVGVTVESNPQLSVTPIELDFGIENIEKTIDIKNTGTGTLSWTITENPDWLSTNPQSGETTTETDNITVTVNRSGLSPGNYSGKITVSTNSENQEINVTMEVPFIDSRDNKTYKTVKIGNQIWMAENLAYLPKVSHPLGGSYTEPYYYVLQYNGSHVSAAKANSNYETIGVLYNWPAAKAACPSGWHLPTDEEWEQLAQYVSDQKGPYTKSGDDWNEVGKHLKATNGWASYESRTDDFGFSALPGGYRSQFGYFEGGYGYWWSATESNNNNAWYRRLNNSKSSFYRDDFSKSYGFSVRCIMD